MYVGYDIALQPDGKIVAVGFGSLSFPTGFAVHRYNANGTLDASFGAGGVVITPLGVGVHAESVLIQADGKIVVVGYSYPIQGDSDFTLVRYNPNGSLDSTFGTGGIVTTSFDVLSIAYGAVLQPDGKIVAIGYTDEQHTLLDFALARYNTDGSLDASFGVGGKVTHATSGVLFDAALQSDGKIVATGSTILGSAIIRFNADGSLDTSFAQNGIYGTGDFNLSSRGGIAVQRDGKPVAFGNANDAFATVRLNSDGTPDATFGATA